MVSSWANSIARMWLNARWRSRYNGIGFCTNVTPVPFEPDWEGMPMSALLSFFETHGLWALFAAIFIEQVGAPIPSFPFLLLSGTKSIDHSLYAVYALAVAALASLIADLLWFYAGKRYGQAILRLLCRVSISPDTCVRKSELSFAKAGLATLVIAKFVPGLSTFAPPMAGAMGMRPVVFVLFNGLGALLWAGSGIVLGMVFHQQIGRVLDYLQAIGWRAMWLVLSLLVVYVAFRCWRRYRMNRLRGRTPSLQAPDLWQLLQAQQAVTVLDMRGVVEGLVWDNNISGAYAMDIKALTQPLPEAWGNEQTLVTFCSCPQDATAVKAAAILRKRGYQAYVLQGGIEAWAAYEKQLFHDS